MDYLFWLEILLIAVALVYIMITPKDKLARKGKSPRHMGLGIVNGVLRMGKAGSVNKPRWYGYHLLISGSTGTGKSTYVEYALTQIINSMSNAKFIVINPHHRKGQWGLGNVIGGGRNYTEIEQGIVDILTLMNERYEKYYNDSSSTFSDVFIIIDELPAIIANTEKGLVGNALKQLSSEARKVNMWLMILSQSKLVKQLGFERASDMLDNFVCVKVTKPKAIYDIDGETVEETFKVVKVDLIERGYTND